MSIISDMLLPFVIRFGWEMVRLEEGTWPRGRAERTKHWLPQTLLHPRTVLDARGPDSGWGGQAVSRGGRPARGPGREAGCAASSQDTRLPLPQPGWARGLRARSLQPPGDAVNLVAHLQKTARFSAPISQGLVTKPWTWRAWLTHSIFTLWDAARSPNGRQEGTALRLLRALRWVEAGTAPCASCGPTLFTLVFVCLLFSLLVTGKLGNHREKHSAVTTLP